MDVLAHFPPLSVLDIFFRKADQPSQQFFIFRFFQIGKHGIDSLIQHFILIQLHVVAAAQPNFTGKRPHGLLKKLIDGADRKRRIIV